MLLLIVFDYLNKNYFYAYFELFCCIYQYDVDVFRQIISAVPTSHCTTSEISRVEASLLSAHPPCNLDALSLSHTVVQQS